MIRQNKLSIAIAAVLASASMGQLHAQETESAPARADGLEEVIVTGLRESLKASMDIKRDAVGVVDAISAEDIGKFPDTNLAEALQRVTGVSIDRRNGEGAVVTARGFGPQFNLVTLNGRQMPTADAFAGGGGNGAIQSGGIGANTRSFNFSNLSADGISGLEVYKTGQADMSSGGIGATVNVKTVKPFDHDGMVLNLGAKGIFDTNVEAGDDVTPEISGIFSYADDDQTWGVSLNASYQKRNSSTSGSTVNDWHIERWNGGPTNLEGNRGAPLFVNNNGTVYGANPGADDFVQAQVINAPADGQLYGIPNDIRYHFTDTESERTNAQLTFQFAPTDALTLTADYTYALNEIVQDRGDQTIWLQRNGFYYIEFDTNEQVKTPLVLREHTGSSKDFGYEQQHREQKNDLQDIGLNADWRVTDNFSLAFDVHDARARSVPNDSVTGGGETTFSLAGLVPSTCTAFYPGAPSGVTPICRNSTNAWDQTFMFNDGLPVAARSLFADTNAMLAGANGNSNYTFNNSSIGSQVLRTNFQSQETDLTQARLDGALEFDDGRFQFGVEARELETRFKGTGGNMSLGNWGVGDVGTVPGMVGRLAPFSLVNAFNDFSAPGAPTGGVKGNANDLARWALTPRAQGGGGYGNWEQDCIPDNQLISNPCMNNDDTIEEETQAVYLQLALRGELGGMPTNLLLGVRYERTDVTSTSLILIPDALLWEDDNDFRVRRSSEMQAFKEEADYDNMLPSLNFDIGLTDTVKARVSYGTTIARAGFGQMTAGATPNGPGGSTLNNFQATGTANNPALVPLESDNLDLSLEWYFSEDGYVAVTFWDKRVTNFIGNAVFDEPIFGIRDQTAGPRAQAALAALGGAADDSALFTMVTMMEHPEGFTDGNGVFWPGGAVAYDGTNAQHVAWATRFDVLPNADDPIYTFGVTKPVNNEAANIHGWEFGGQYFFGSTGFGIQANYTVVRGDIGFNDTADPNENQFALLGLSDSANLVLMYENFGFTARLAYNWRDEFLQTVNNGGWRSPIYVEEYDQIDFSVGYEFNEHLSVLAEGINLTGEDIRWHGRSEKQLWRLDDQSARYAVGARYKF